MTVADVYLSIGNLVAVSPFTFTGSKTFPNVSNGYLLACIQVSSPTAPDLVTWNGVSLSSLFTTSVGSGTKHYWYGLPTPSTGSSYDIVVSLDALQYVNVGLWLLDSAKQTGQPDATTDISTGVSGTAATSVTTSANNSTVFQWINFGAGSATADANTTLDTQAADINVGMMAMLHSTNPVTPTGSFTISGSFTSSGWNTSAISLSPSPQVAVKNVIPTLLTLGVG